MHLIPVDTLCTQAKDFHPASKICKLETDIQYYYSYLCCSTLALMQRLFSQH